MSIALVIGLALVALAIGVTLTHSPATVLAANGIAEETELGASQRGASACQGGETVPAGTSAIRLTLVAEIGPRVTVTVTSPGRLLTRGTRGADWTGSTVTVPVRTVRRGVSGARLCFTVATALEPVRIFGARSSPSVALLASGGQRLAGRTSVEYLRPGPTSWASLIPSIARNMGSGHAWPGTWIVFMLVAAMVGCAAVLSWLALRELR